LLPIICYKREVMKDKHVFGFRIASIKNADKIIVMDDGHIVEQGIHKDLVKIKGIYFDLFEKQKLEETLNQAA